MSTFCVYSIAYKTDIFLLFCSNLLSVEHTLMGLSRRRSWSQGVLVGGWTVGVFLAPRVIGCLGDTGQGVFSRALDPRVLILA